MGESAGTAPASAQGTAQAVGRERRGLLTFGGVLLLLMAGMFLMFVPFMLFGAMLGPASAEGAVMGSRAMSISTALTYAGMGGFFGMLGIGSLRAQRWVRPLVMATGWMWLLFGVVGLVMMYLMLPRLLETAAIAAGDRAMPANVQGMVVAVTLTFFALLGVALPVFLLLLYNARGVRLALEHSQPEASRLERVPTAVLTLALAFAFAAFSGVTTALWFPAMPLFGWVVTGWAATLLQLLLAAVSSWLAWELFHRRMAGWWGTMALTVFFAVSLGMTGRAGLERTYLALGMAEAEVAELMSLPLLQAPLLWYGMLFLLLMGYMVYIRRHFVDKKTS